MSKAQSTDTLLVAVERDLEYEVQKPKHFNVFAVGYDVDLLMKAVPRGWEEGTKIYKASEEVAQLLANYPFEDGDIYVQLDENEVVVSVSDWRVWYPGKTYFLGDGGELVCGSI